MLKRNKILITGSSGMLGIDLYQQLKGSYEIYGADLAARGQGPKGTRFKKVNITERRQVATVLSKIKPDIVIHTAAYTDVDGCELDPKKAYSINSEGAKNIALACKTIDSVLVYISTDFVFDGRKKKPYKEMDKPNPLSVYAKSKLAGEKAVRKALKKYFILRTSWLYGRNGRNFVDTIIAKGKEGNALKVVDDQVGSPTYTKDLAKAIHALIDRVFAPNAQRSMQYGIYHVTNSGSVSWFDYTKEILRLKKINIKVMPITSDQLDRPAKRPAMSVLDNSKFRVFTGCRMRKWQEALKDYV